MSLDEFSTGVRVAHFFNCLFLSLLVRSGIEILGAHPKLYWRDHCSPGDEWIRFTRKRMPAHQLGYKMAKWVDRIELVADFRGIGKGQGGWRDDVLNYYPSDAGI